MLRTKSEKIEINPEVINWAISSSGWDKSELISKLHISEPVYGDWLKGNITITQLENLANKLKRPLAIFLLPKAPEEKPKPKDYRMLPGKYGKFNKKTILAIRKARYLQGIIQELAINIENDLKPKIMILKITDDPEEIAVKYRGLLDFSVEKQTTELKDAYKVYSYLRGALEDKNIYSFQISMPIEDARGFALSDKDPKVIVANSQDEIEARIFTLMHEFGHVLLGETAISLSEFQTQDKIERWCNQFASNFLLPKELAQSIFSQKQESFTETKTLNTLKRKYKVSKAMLVYNMFNLNLITQTIYNSILERPTQIKPEGKQRIVDPRTQDQKCIAELGHKLPSLVADNMDKGFITYSDALSYLSIKTKYLEKVIKRTFK
ncbi:MAG TPA: ImmA/IrrE family metallo-endopeptidase [Candidatus Nanoarchaeia archaeon]|nr:ImmA/IrrE family metallo-endopeptidase [Candidatus Nanoarchaeia archaeon]